MKQTCWNCRYLYDRTSTSGWWCRMLLVRSTWQLFGGSFVHRQIPDPKRDFCTFGWEARER